MAGQPYEGATDVPDAETHWYGHGEAPSAGFHHMISETQAVCLALADLGSDASPEAVQKYLRDVGMEVPTEVIERIRAELERHPNHCPGS